MKNVWITANTIEWQTSIYPYLCATMLYLTSFLDTYGHINKCGVCFDPSDPSWTSSRESSCFWFRFHFPGDYCSSYDELRLGRCDAIMYPIKAQVKNSHTWPTQAKIMHHFTDCDTELDDNCADFSVFVQTGRQFSAKSQFVYLFVQHQFTVNALPCHLTCKSINLVIS